MPTSLWSIPENSQCHMLSNWFLKPRDRNIVPRFLVYADDYSLPAGGVELFSFSDTFDRADGALGNGWTGATWTIAGNQAVNTPATGAELLVNPGFEGTYDTEAVGIDIAPNWNLTGLDTGTDTASKELTLIHGGSAAQKWTCDSSEGIVCADNIASVAHTWYSVSAWVRNSGAAEQFRFEQFFGNWQGVLHTAFAATAIYVKYLVVFRGASTGSERLMITAAANPNTLYVDDASVKALTFSSLFAFRPPSGVSLVTVKVAATIVNLTQAGVALNWDSATNPQNGVIGYFDRAGAGGSAAPRAKLVKYVAGVPTDLLATNTTYVPGAVVEVRHTAATTFQLWYNNNQIDTDQTIADVGIINNDIHGAFSTDNGNTLNDFFSISALAGFESAVWMGTSITSGGNTDQAEVDSFRAMGGHWLQAQRPSKYLTNWNGSIGGSNVWNALVRLQTDLIDHAPTLLVTMDAANNGNNTFHNATCEAFIRRVWTVLPSVPIVWYFSISVQDGTVNDPLGQSDFSAAANAAQKAICAHYGVPYVDYHDEVARRVAAEENDLIEFYDDGDYVHQNALGNSVYHLLQQPIILAAIAAGGIGGAALPARLYAESEAYERTPTRLLGTDYDIRTGVWSDSGTSVSSSAAGATITYTATCQSIGAYRASGVMPTVELSIDGGAFASFALHQNGTELGVAYGPHTIAIKVVSGTVRIDEFWAI